MSKNRKTRKQKEITQLRHQLNQQQSSKPVQKVVKPQDEFSFNPTRTTNQSINVVTISHYTYLPKEIRKSALLSLLIIIVEIGLFFILKTHALVLPNLMY